MTTATSNRLRILSVAIPGAIVLAVTGYMILHGSDKRDRRKAERAAENENQRRVEQVVGRRRALSQLEPCLQQVEWDEEDMRRGDAATPDRRANPPQRTSALSRCIEIIVALEADKTYLTPPGPAALKQLRDADAAIAKTTQDKVAFAAAVARRHRAFRDVRALVLPQLRDKLLALRKIYETAHGRDQVWWQVELWFGFWGTLETALVASELENGGAVNLAAAAAAMREPLAKVLAGLSAVPPPLVQAVSDLDYFTGPIAAGSPLDVSTLVRFLNNDMAIPSATIDAVLRLPARITVP